jgi:ATP-binding cassette subfamily B protein
VRHLRTALSCLLRAGGAPAWSVLGLSVLAGLAPVGSVAATGVLLAAAVNVSWPTAAAGLALFATAQVVTLLAAAALDAIVPIADSRRSAAVHTAIAAATLGTNRTERLESPETVARLAALAEAERADGFTRTAAALREIITRRTTGMVALAMVTMIAWWAPVPLLAAWYGMGVAVRRWIAKGASASAGATAAALRRPRYLRELATGPEAAKEVRLFGLADWLVRGYSETYRVALAGIWRDRGQGMRAISAAVAGLAAAHVLVVGWAAVAGSLSVPELVVALQAVLATSAMGYLGDSQLVVARAAEADAQIRALRTELAPRPPTARPSADVRLRDIRFTYPGQDTPALDGLDLDIPAGQCLAVVGANGAGKSTLMKVLCGLYTPQHGTVAAPAQVGAIFQNFLRYELPLRDNVSLTPLPTATLAEALDRVGGAALAEVGWDTVLNAAYPGGRDLSGGQWQKIALARALVAVERGAGLLVLDEPSAALDVRAEIELFDRFRTVTAGVTTVLVSHRMASVCRADRIVVLDQGRIVEDGDHASLMALGGRYASLFTVQAARFAADTEEHAHG